MSGFIKRANIFIIIFIIITPLYVRCCTISGDVLQFTLSCTIQIYYVPAKSSISSQHLTFCRLRLRFASLGIPSVALMIIVLCVCALCYVLSLPLLLSSLFPHLSISPIPLPRAG